VSVAGVENVAGRHVRALPHEEIVDREQALSVVQAGDGHGHFLVWSRPPHDVGKHGGQIASLKGQEHAVPAVRRGIEPHQRLAGQVLEGIGDHAVLADGEDDVLGAEEEVGQEGPVQHVGPAVAAQAFPGRGQAGVVLAPFPFVVREVRAQVLDVEPRLPHGVEAHQQLLKAGLPLDQDQPAFARAFAHLPGRLSSSCSSSGLMLRLPMRSARSAIPWKAAAMSCCGFMPALASACSTAGSTPRKEFMVVAMP
jgi:hypothetical protein